ncbi:MAG: hypothetical protein ACI97P_000468 [Arcticibacterium sp.]|jgi:hypothetical protein
MRGLQKNASTSEVASGFLGVVTRKYKGKILDNLGGLF